MTDIFNTRIHIGGPCPLTPWLLRTSRLCRIIYGKPINDSFSQKTENVQSRACLGITGAIQRTSRDKLYQKLRLESLSEKRWYRKLVFFQKIINNLSPTYFTAYLSTSTPPSLYNTRISNQNTFRNISCKAEHLKNVFYPYCISE